MDMQKDERTQIDRGTDGQTEDRQMLKWTNGWKDGRTQRQKADS